MRHDPLYQPITVEEFLAIDFGTDKKFELKDGVIVMMTGGSEPHSWVQGNIFAWFKRALRGTSCRPYGSDMAVKIDDSNIRYPDVSIYCNAPPRDELTETRALHSPTVVIEVLSPSTTTLDQGAKQEEYRSIPSVQTIVFVDPVNELIRSVERQGSESWIDYMFSGERGIEVPSLKLVMPHADVFDPN